MIADPIASHGRVTISIPRRLAAAGPALLTTVMFAWPLMFDTYLLGSDQYSLGRTIQIEWLLIGGGMLYVFPLFIQPTTRNGNRVRTIAFFLLAGTFMYGAFDLDGLRGLATFVFLLVVSYGGNTLFIREARARNVFALLAAGRWVVSVFTFFPLVVYFGLSGDISHWDSKEATVKLGAAFFAILFVLELTLYAWLTAYCVKQFGRPFGAGGDPAARNDLIERRRRFYRQLRKRD